MKFWPIVAKNLPANAMALFPFILFKKEKFKHDEELINHEKIHLKQQLELLVLPFYFLYFLNYLFNLFKYKNHYLAYFNICFEREAFHFEQDLTYLEKRKWYSWLKFLL
jgi:hypothetical protein